MQNPLKLSGEESLHPSSAQGSQFSKETSLCPSPLVGNSFLESYKVRSQVPENTRIALYSIKAHRRGLMLSDPNALNVGHHIIIVIPNSMAPPS